MRTLRLAALLLATCTAAMVGAIMAVVYELR